MSLRALLINLKKDATYQSVCQVLAEQQPCQTWLTGLHGSSRAFFWSGFRERLRQPMLIILPTLEEAKQVYDQCRLYLQHPDPDKEELFLFPSRELLPYEHALIDMDLEGERLEVAFKLIKGDNIMVITSIDQVLERLPDPAWLLDRVYSLHLGQHLDLDGIAAQLVELGYTRETTITGRGQFAIRGGILDIFSPCELSPWRIEMEGSEILTIRRFALTGQETTTPGTLSEVDVTPAKFVVPTQQELKLGMDRLNRSFGMQRVQYLRDKIEQNPHFPGFDNYGAHFIPTGSLLDYFGDQTIVVLEQPGACKQKSDEQLKINERLYQEHRKKEPAICQPSELVDAFDGLKEKLAPKRVLMTGLLKQSVWETYPSGHEWAIPIKATTPLRGNLTLLVKEIEALHKKGLAITIAAHNDAEVRRLKQVLSQQLGQLDKPELLSQLQFVTGQLTQGFHYPACQLVVMSDQEIFNRHLGRLKPRRQKGLTYPSQPINDILELKKGDLAVHRDHGVARYLGVTKLSIDGPDQEFVCLAYAGDEKLYVPMDQLRLVEKYIGGEHAPRINKLGSSSWEKTKQRIKESVTEIARQLLDIYAARQTHQAYHFSEDTVLQREFEEAFPYEETPDQLRAIEETKQDMMSSKPMDRLICGDVGYGKTEVAMRAAFKAVQDGLQVAVLVPTTILADQHYATFKERMATYPVKIELLSRFRNQREINNIRRQVSEGKIDILIGTHKLLGSQLKFKQLGLFVLDEEQRFGVAQKEKLKKLRSTVDVLTLSATPIPRTLYLSLSGIRDISVIETPPLNRLPIKTQVMEFSESAIREAITRELARNGQVFFIHNRVQSIGAMAERIKHLVPEARLAIAHGQMKRDEIEPVMERFLAKVEDILVSTTIVESGLDMPNVNTIVINRADALGLAQLYQLRGRVGRADRQAYAYLLYPQGGAVTKDAEKRLSSLQEFTELGSGIKIAMRDMEIRGTGDVLGPDQSGHVTSVGFETYCSLLEEAVREIKGQQQHLGDVSMTMPVDAFLSKDYVPDTMARLNLYRHLSTAASLQEIERIQQDINQRYGSLPGPALTLIAISRLKHQARLIGLKDVRVNERTITMTWPKYYQPEQRLVDRLLANQLCRVRFIPGDEISLEMVRSQGDPVMAVKNCLSELIGNDIKN